ncbi:hypothetical protein D9M70_604570 [compost metagenome]
MAFHLEDDAVAIANVDNTGIFAGALDNAWAGCRECAKPLLRRLVGTMFIPHGRENAEFREARFASDQVENTLIFVRLEAVGRDKFRRDVALIGNSH